MDAPKATPWLPVAGPWLMRLRLYVYGFSWISASAALWVGGAEARMGALAGLFLLSAMGNLAYHAVDRKREDPGHRRLGLLLVSDVFTLSILLFATGGAANPLTIFLVIPVMVSALMLGTRWSWGIATLCGLAYGLLFPFHLPLDGISHQAHDRIDLHLYWMYGAFLGVIGSVALLMSRLVRALEEEREKVIQDRARMDRFAAVAALAGGAAHELATPLATIAVVSRELERGRPPPGDLHVKEDAALIRQEVDRCRRILDRMHPSTLGSRPEPAGLRGVVQEVAGAFGARVRVEAEGGNLQVLAPPGLLRMGVQALLSNAVDASPPYEPVEVRLAAGGGGVSLSVSDHGPGLPSTILGRVGEPFVTTKAPGRGMGLGLFIVRRLVDECGGQLRFEGVEGGGTRVLLWIPHPPTALEVATGD